MPRRWAVDPDAWRSTRPEDCYDIVVDDDPWLVIATGLTFATAEDIVAEHNAEIERLRQVPHGASCFSLISDADPCDCGRGEVLRALDGGAS